MERLDEAAAWFQKSIDIVDEKGLVLPVLGISLANLGGTRMLQGRVEEAIALYDRAQSVLDETMVEESIWVELLRCQRGYALLRHGEHDAAFEAMIEAIDRLEREQDHDPLYRGECRLAFAEALALTPAHERPPAAVAAARGRTARQWADRAAVDLEAAQPRAKRLMQRLDRLRKRLAP
jgi:tetratricopeptide (TPR) repeat protein